MFNHKWKRMLCIGMIAALLFGLCSCNFQSYPLHIYEDIDECNNIELLKETDATITRIDTPKNDKYLKELSAEQFYGCEYRSSAMSFELFAYEFSSYEESMEYFENATGKSHDNRLAVYSDSGGVFEFRRVAANENKAYIVYCKPIDEGSVLTYINSCFSIDVTDDVLIKKDSE